MQKPIHFATVVTDLTTCHNTWFHKGVSKCFIPTLEAKKCGLKMGLKPAQLVKHGLPIRPTFSEHMAPQHKLRRQLGLDRAQPAVLLVGECPHQVYGRAMKLVCWLLQLRHVLCLC